MSLVQAVVLLSDAADDKTSTIANFSILVLVVCPGRSVEPLIMLLKGLLLLLLLMSLKVLVFGDLLSLVLITGQGPELNGCW